MITQADFFALIPDTTASVCSTFKKWLRWPIVFYTWFKDTTNTDGSIKGLVAIGDYIYASTPSSETANRLLANGQEIAKADYPELWAAYGGTHLYGTPTTNSVVNFKLPDMRAKFPVMVGNFTNVGAISLGVTMGEDQHVLTEGETPKHIHFTTNLTAVGGGAAQLSDALPYVNFAADGTAPGGGAQAVYGYTLTGSATVPTCGKTTGFGNDNAHNNLPPCMGQYVYVRVK